MVGKRMEGLQTWTFCESYNSGGTEGFQGLNIQILYSHGAGPEHKPGVLEVQPPSPLL